MQHATTDVLSKLVFRLFAKSIPLFKALSSADDSCMVPPNGNVRYQLKTPYRDGTTHVIFEPLDFIARMAALASKPQTNLTRVHTVIAPDSKRSEPVGWAPVKCPLRSSVIVSRVRVILAVVCWLLPFMNDWA
jgi:hypothetical protein